MSKEESPFKFDNYVFNPPAGNSVQQVNEETEDLKKELKYTKDRVKTLDEVYLEREKIKTDMIALCWDIDALKESEKQRDAYKLQVEELTAELEALKS